MSDLPLGSLALVAVLPAALTLVPVSSAWVDVLGLVRWPIIAGIVILALAIVYRYAPDRAQPRWRWICWGAAGATVLWILGLDRLHDIRLEDRQLRQDLR